MARRTRLSSTLAASAAAILVTGLVGAPSASAASAPVLKSLTPHHGGTSGGIRVYLYGSGFTHVRSVRFGAVPGNHLHVVSSASITVKAPAHVAGRVYLTVRTF